MAYPKQPHGENSCGAYAIAYLLAQRGIIGEGSIDKEAHTCYRRIQFSDDFAKKCRIQKGYSNPIKMIEYLESVNAEIHFFSKEDLNASKSANPLCAIFCNLKELNDLTDKINTCYIHDDTFSADILTDGSHEDSYLIEIVGSGEALHYILTYANGENLVCLDPADGGKHNRSELADKYIFLDAGIMVAF